jgi:hypothetical protein
LAEFRVQGGNFRTAGFQPLVVTIVIDRTSTTWEKQLIETGRLIAARQKLWAFLPRFPFRTGARIKEVPMYPLQSTVEEIKASEEMDNYSEEV